MAAGAQKNGTALSHPKMRVRVSTSRTLHSTRGCHHTRSNAALFAFAVARSVAADEKNAHVFLERVRAAMAADEGF